MSIKRRTLKRHAQKLSNMVYINILSRKKRTKNEPRKANLQLNHKPRKKVFSSLVPAKPTAALQYQNPKVFIFFFCFLGQDEVAKIMQNAANIITTATANINIPSVEDYPFASHKQNQKHMQFVVLFFSLPS